MSKYNDKLQCLILYSIRPKLCDILTISHILKNVINFLCKRHIMSFFFIKLSLINSIRKINQIIEKKKAINN